MKYCSYCGAKLEDNSKFCPECGTKLAVEQQVQEFQSMTEDTHKKSKLKKCSRCKSMIPKSAKKCRVCGKKQGKLGRILVSLLIILIGLIIIGMLFGEDNGTSAPKEVVYLDDSEIENVWDNPNDYKGKYLKVSGKVFNMEKSDGELYLQVYADIENLENDFTVYYYGDDADVELDDYVVIDGYITGERTGTNAFGGEIVEAEVTATSLTLSNYKDAVRPTLKEVTVGQKVECGGMALTLDKVEYAEKETRIYFTAENGSQDSAELYTYSPSLVQGSSQYEISYNYEGEYEELPSDPIAPGVTATGVMVFDAMDQNTPFTITIEGCDEETFDSMEFSFEVNPAQ